MEPTNEAAFDFGFVSQQYSSEIDRVKLLLDTALAGPAGPETAVERTVVYFLVVSCRSLVAETLHSLGGGFGRAAVRNVRTMYETVVAARYIHLHPMMGKHLLDTLDPQWAKIMQNVPNEERSPTMDAQISAKVPKYGVGQPITNKDIEWSDTHIRQMAREAGKVFELHPYAFDQASGYVHPSGMYLTRMIERDHESGQLFARTRFDFEGRFALRLAHDLVLNAVDLRLKYFSTPAVQDLFDACKTDFKAIWHYAPHI